MCVLWTNFLFALVALNGTQICNPLFWGHIWHSACFLDGSWWLKRRTLNTAAEWMVAHHNFHVVHIQLPKRFVFSGFPLAELCDGDTSALPSSI